MHYCCTYDSPIGLLTLAADGESLTGLWMEGQLHFAQGHPKLQSKPDLPVFRQVVAWLDDYFAGKAPSAEDLPLKPTGSPFRQEIWRILVRIPYGKTVTYGQIATMLGRPMSAQAVGNAVGHNPIGIIIPCHRVLGNGGKLTGYAGGTDRKHWLLRHEGSLN